MQATQSRPSDNKDMIPKPLLLAMLTLVLATLAVVSFSVLTDRDRVGVPAPAAVVAERTIYLQGGGAQAVTVLDENRALLFQAFNHEAVMDNLMAHINRRAVAFQRFFHNLDGAVHAGAKTMRGC